MQPLQRSYAITAERMEAMLSKGSLSSLYDQAKVDEIENMEEPTGKDLKKLENYQHNQPVYEAIIAALKEAVSDEIYLSPAAFMPVLTRALANVTADKKLLEKIADGLSAMDKSAEIQRDRKGNILYDKETKDTEIVKWEEDIKDYMAREVLPISRTPSGSLRRIWEPRSRWSRPVRRSPSPATSTNISSQCPARNWKPNLWSWSFRCRSV